MSEVDVFSEIVIGRPVEEVAAYSVNPDNAVNWYLHIESVERKTPPPLRVGSRFAFVVYFLSRRLDYVCEVVELVPSARLVMRALEGPFLIQAICTWSSTSGRNTHMTLRNQGSTTGLLSWVAPLISFLIRRANQKHLTCLKELLEDRPLSGGT